MSLTSGFESNAIGMGGGGFGGFGGGFGGLGAVGLFGLIGLDGLRGRHGHDDDGGGCRNELATLQAIAGAKDQTVFEGRALAAAICGSEMASAQQAYAAAIQAERNQQQLGNQMTALAIANNQNITELKEAGVLQTAAIIARINESEKDALLLELAETRHGLRSKEIEISISNQNTAVATQFQQQEQKQMVRDFDVHRRIDGIFGSFNQIGNQLAWSRSQQENINVGGLQATTQTANPTSVNGK